MDFTGKYCIICPPQKTQVICHENKNYRGQVERKQHDDSNWPLNRGGFFQSKNIQCKTGSFEILN